MFYFDLLMITPYFINLLIFTALFHINSGCFVGVSWSNNKEINKEMNLQRVYTNMRFLAV